MSTQDADSIPLSYDRQQQGLRLLELPPELLDLLGGPDPPQLSLKSIAPTAKGQSGHVVLCTPTQTYNLRQVQTSNTVFVTRPTPVDGDDGITNTSMCAFAKCGSMLELHPQTTDEKGKTKPTKEYLEAVLRVYSGPEDDLDDAAAKGLTKKQLFKDIPYSQRECEQAWTELIAFERHHTCWRPHSRVLLQLWNQVLEAATAEGLDISKQLGMKEIRSAIEDLAAPDEVLVAMLQYLSGGVDPRWRTRALDRAIVVAWTCQLVVREAQKEDAVPGEDLLSTWKEALPEMWREDASLELLAQEREKHKQQTQSLAVSKTEDEVLNASGKRPAKGRNWHEKFKKGRK